jgi:hypothetical protein
MLGHGPSIESRHASPSTSEIELTLDEPRLGVAGPGYAPASHDPRSGSDSPLRPYPSAMIIGFDPPTTEVSAS